MLLEFFFFSLCFVFCSYFTYNYFIFILFYFYSILIIGVILFSCGYSILNLNFIFLISFLWVIIILKKSFIGFKKTLIMSFSITLFLIASGMIFLFISSNVIMLTFSFELIMLSSLFLLKLFSKSERIFESLFDMYFWSIISSFFLLTGIVLDISFSGFGLFYIDFIFISFFIGFAIKVPLWPFTSWLLKAHVEASTEFSIFLSGFLVKFGVFAILKLFWLLNYDVSFMLMLLSLIGLFDAFVRLWFQVDLKRIVALTTIVETNWLILCISFDSLIFFNLGLLLILVHCFTTTIEFYLVEFIFKRYGTRNILLIGNMSVLYEKLYFYYFLSILIIIGLPGTVVFFLKIFFFINIIQVDLVLLVLLGFLFLVLLPIFFIKLCLLIKGNLFFFKNKSKLLNSIDITINEKIIILAPLFFCYFFFFFFIII